MAEELEPRLAGIDGPRPLPPAVRARLEAAVLAAAGTLPAGLDSPRPLPSPLRARLEAAVQAAAAGPRRRPARLARGLAAVAVLVLVLGIVANLGGRAGQRDEGRQVAAGGPATATTGETGNSPSTGASDTATSTTAAVPPARPAPAPTVAATRAALPRAAVTADPGKTGASTASGSASPAPRPAGPEPSPTASSSPEHAGAPAQAGSGDAGPAPPYAYPAATSAADQAPEASASPGRSEGPSGAPLRIGVVGGDPAQEAGFRAYVELLNRAGGVRHRAIELVAVGPGQSADGVLATVNLSPRPVAGASGSPAWAAGPLLETFTATEPLLTGRVFGFASPPERQGHLVASAVFPQPAAGATAVIYRAAEGPLAEAVPRAIERVLSDRGVNVTVELYDPAKPSLLRPADAAFLSLEPDAARSFLRQAQRDHYAPARGLAGVYSLFEPSLLSDLPDGTRVIAPYVVPAGQEREAIQSSAKGTGVGVLHGWATAKSLAVALWQSGAETPDQVTAALEGLAGYDSGLAPPYEVRPGTHSRTPEGALFEVASGAFNRTGGFRRDPY